MCRKLFFSLLIIFYSVQTFALPFGGFDVRSIAMGGTGVASADAAGAAHFNPALLASTYNDDELSLVVPAFTIGPLDFLGLVGTFSSFAQADYITGLTTALADYNSAANPAAISSAATSTATAAQSLLTGLIDLTDALSLSFETKLGFLFALPYQDLGIAAYTSNSTIIGSNLDFSDASLIQSYIDIASCIGGIDSSLATGTAPQQLQYTTELNACYAASPGLIDSGTGEFTNSDLGGSLTSSVKVRGAYIKEAGVSLASTFPSLEYASLGITIKSVQVDVFDTAVSINSSSISTSGAVKKYSNRNYDVGIVLPLSNHLKVGGVIKNIVRKDYTSVLNNIIKIEPQLRVGVAYQNDWSVFSADFDVVRNKSFAFGSETQYIAFGTEFDMYDAMQMRLGFRNNILNPDTVYSAGLGMVLLGMNTDFALTYGNNGFEFGFQAGVKF